MLRTRRRDPPCMQHSPCASPHHAGPPLRTCLPLKPANRSRTPLQLLSPCAVRSPCTLHSPLHAACTQIAALKAQLAEAKANAQQSKQACTWLGMGPCLQQSPYSYPHVPPGAGLDQCLSSPALRGHHRALRRQQGCPKGAPRGH